MIRRAIWIHLEKENNVGYKFNFENGTNTGSRYSEVCNFRAVLWIRVALASMRIRPRKKLDRDPGKTLKSQKVKFLHEKYGTYSIV